MRALGDESPSSGVPDEALDTPTDRLSSTRRRRRVRVRLLFVIWLAGSFFYLWTATSSGDPIVIGSSQTDYYNQLTNGFLRGELSIPTVPPAGLVHLSNPYDPAENAPWQTVFHDLSLYDGHLYLSWGAAPVVTLFLPWRVLGVGGLPENLAVLIYSVVGLAFMLALLELLVDRYLPRVSAFRVTLCGLALATSSVIPYLLRRPIYYEVALSCGYAFVAAGLYFFARARFSRRRRWIFLALGSLCLGVAVGARFELLLLGVVVALIAIEVYLGQRGLASPARIRELTAVLLPWTVVVLLVLAYNLARFHNPFQIGSAYQLAAFNPVTTPSNQLGYVTPGLYYYVFAPVRLTPAFPFVMLPPPAFYPGVIPNAYSPEIVGGVLTVVPILVVLLAATFVLRRQLADLGRIVLVLVVVSVALMGAISFAVPGGTMRYEADFASLLVLAASTTWLAWQPAKPLIRRLVTGIGALLILIGALIGVAISITGPNDQLQTGNSALYDALESHFSFVNQELAALDGKAEVIRVLLPGVTYPSNLGNYGTYDAGSLRFGLVDQPEEIDLAAPRSGTYELVSRLERTASAPPKGAIDIHLQNGTEQQTAPLEYPHQYSAIVRLSAGLNRVYVWATFSGKQPLGANPEIVNVYGLSVVSVHAAR